MDNNMNPNQDPTPTSGLRLAGQDNSQPTGFGQAQDAAGQMYGQAQNVYGQAQDMGSQVYGQGQNMYGQAQDMGNQVYGQAQNAFGQAQDMSGQVYGQGQNMYGQAQNVYGQAQNTYGQPYGGMQPGVNPAFGGGNGGMNMPPKKKSGGKIAGIIAICVAAIALIVCGILFIPKLFKSNKERVEDAIIASMNTKTTLTAFDERVGMDAINDKFVKDGGTVKYNVTLKSVGGVTDAAGVGVYANVAKDNAAKQLSGEVGLSASQGDIISFVFAADEAKTYLAAPELFDGYFSIPNQDALRKLQNSPLGKAANMYGMPEVNLDYFSDASITSEAMNDTLFSSELWKKANVKSAGLKSVTIGGKDVKAKKYTVTFKEKDLEAELKKAVDKGMETLTSNPEYLEQLGVDASQASMLTQQVSSIVPMLVDGDFTLNVFVKDGKAISIAANDSLTIMGSSMEYGFYINKYDGVSEGNFSLGAAGTNIGFSYEIKMDGSNINGTVKTYGPGMNFAATIEGGFTGDSFNLKLDAPDAKVTAELTGSVTDVNAGSSFTLNLDSIKVTADGAPVIEAEATVAVDASTKATSLPQGKEYDLTTMDESAFSQFIQENQAKMQDWSDRMAGLFGGGDIELPDPDPDMTTEEGTTEESTTEKGNTEVEDTIKKGDHEYKINPADGFELSYGCEYFVDLEKNGTMVEYELATEASADKVLPTMVTDLSAVSDAKDVKLEDPVTLKAGDKDVLVQVQSYTLFDMPVKMYYGVMEVEPGLFMAVSAYVYDDKVIASTDDFAKLFDAKFFTKVK